MLLWLITSLTLIFMLFDFAFLRDAGGVDMEKCSKAIQVSDKMKGVMYFT